MLMIQYGGRPGALSYTLLEACCVYGGGHTDSTALLMNPFSSVSCSVQNDIVYCRCGDSLKRYEESIKSCVSSCPSGTHWNELNLVQITSEVGTCVRSVRGQIAGITLTQNSTHTQTQVSCERGFQSLSVNGTNVAFPSECTICIQGKFSKRGSATCEECAANTYQPDEGQSMCLNCPGGKISISESGSWACESCEFMYMGSNRCDVPIMGIIVVASTALFLLIIYCIAMSQYRSWNRRIKEEKIKKDAM